MTIDKNALKNDLVLNSRKVTKGHKITPGNVWESPDHGVKANKIDRSTFFHNLSGLTRTNFRGNLEPSQTSTMELFAKIIKD